MQVGQPGVIIQKSSVKCTAYSVQRPAEPEIYAMQCMLSGYEIRASKWAVLWVAVKLEF